MAAELHLTTAALHYHFAGKAALGRALIERYAAQFAEALAVTDERERNGRAKLDAYAELYADVLGEQRRCLCGMLAAEYRTLPRPMRDAVIRFFETNEIWLARVLEEGRAAGTLRFTGSAREVARAIVSGLEGAMLVARPYDDPFRFRAAARLLIDSLSASEALGRTGHRS